MNEMLRLDAQPENEKGRGAHTPALAQLMSVLIVRISTE